MYLKQRAEEARQDAEGSVPILAPEPALAPSFDPDVTGYRYRVMEDPSGIIARWVGVWAGVWGGGWVGEMQACTQALHRRAALLQTLPLQRLPLQFFLSSLLIPHSPSAPCPRPLCLSPSLPPACRPIVSDGAVDHEDGIDSVQVEKQAILRPKGQYLGGVPAVAWAQVQKDKSQFSFQGEWEVERSFGCSLCGWLDGFGGWLAGWLAGWVGGWEVGKVEGWRMAERWLEPLGPAAALQGTAAALPASFMHA